MLAKDDPAGCPLHAVLQRNAAVTLGNVGATQDAYILEQALDDPEPLVREHAASALTRL